MVLLKPAHARAIWPAILLVVFSALLCAATNGGKDTAANGDKVTAANGGKDTAADGGKDKVYSDCEEAKQKCEALGKSFKSSSLKISHVFSQYYPVGSNPSLEYLAMTYPAGILPKKPKLYDLLRGVAPDVDLSREAGYGWNANTRVSSHGPLGGLPAFCRFGAAINTSAETTVVSEVWLPLASDPKAPLAQLNATDFPTNSTPVQLGPGESFIKAPTWLTEAIKVNGTVHPNQKDGTYLPPSKKKDNGTTTSKTPSTSSDSGSASASACGLQFEARRDVGYLTGEEVLGSPEQGWNGRLMHLGNGGQRGFVPYPTMKMAMSRYGFAVSGTNTGHFSITGGVSWVNGTQYDQTLKDWGGYSTHITKVLADEVILNFYSDAPKKSYFSGCSVGGKTGVASAQQYPGTDPKGKKDFDGILAGSPAVNFNRMNAGQIFFQKKHRKKSIQDKGEWFAVNYTQYPVHQTILAQCDKLDGVEDGIVSFTRQCKPDFESYLLCGKAGAKFGGSPDTCLNATQIANLKSMYEDFTLDGELVYPAYLYTWEQRSVGLTGAAAKAGGWFALAVLKKPDLTDANEFKYWTDLTLDVIKQGDNTVWDGSVTDLSPAFNAGTKLITYHGLSDITISPYNTANYYEKVGKAVEGKIKGKLSDYYQHYEIPGMSHCRDGAGPWHFGGPTQEDGGNRPYKFDTRHDMTLKLIAWVEQGHLEPFSVGAHYETQSRLLNDDPTAGPPQKWDPVLPTTYADYSYGLTFTRKLCPYPQVAKYVGGAVKGPHAWRSFECKNL